MLVVLGLRQSGNVTGSSIPAPKLKGTRTILAKGFASITKNRYYNQVFWLSLFDRNGYPTLPETSPANYLQAASVGIYVLSARLYASKTDGLLKGLSVEAWPRKKKITQAGENRPEEGIRVPAALSRGGTISQLLPGSSGSIFNYIFF